MLTDYSAKVNNINNNDITHKIYSVCAKFNLTWIYKHSLYIECWQPASVYFAIYSYKYTQHTNIIHIVVYL